MLEVSSVSFRPCWGSKVYLPLVAEGSVVIFASSVRPLVTPQANSSKLRDSRCSVMQAHAVHLAGALSFEFARHGAVHTNLKGLCGGEIFSRPLAQGFFRLGGELWKSVMCPTETCTICRRFTVVDSADEDDSLVDRPIANPH